MLWEALFCKARTIIRHLHIIHPPRILSHQPTFQLFVLSLQVLQIPLRLPDLVVKTLLDGSVVGR